MLRDGVGHDLGVTRGRLEAFSDGVIAILITILIMAAFSYGFLVRALMAAPGQTSTLAEALAGDFKGRISPMLYLVAIPIAFVAPLVSFGIYVFVAAMWIVPDPRIERRIAA